MVYGYLRYNKPELGIGLGIKPIAGTTKYCN